MKTAYISLSVETLHHGHINLIKQAKKYGDVIAGLPHRQSNYKTNKKITYLSYEQRKKLLENIVVCKVVLKMNGVREYNILKYKPDFLFMAMIG